MSSKGALRALIPLLVCAAAVLSAVAFDANPPVAFVATLSTAGTIVPRAIAVDPRGNSYLAGLTDSTDLPANTVTRVGSIVGEHIFVAKLNASGASFDYILHIGANRARRPLTGGPLTGVTALAVDAVGQLYATGTTFATDFPTVNAAQPSPLGTSWDAFAFKLSTDGRSLLYSTYIGGRDAGGRDNGTVAIGIGLDALGSAYITGTTTANEFPFTTDLSASRSGSVFVVKLSPVGSQQFAVRVGGAPAYDRPTAISVDGSGQAILVGQAGSVDFPTRNAVQPTCPALIPTVSQRCDAGFAAKLNAFGSGFVYSTFIGGVDPSSVVADGVGNAVIGAVGQVPFSTEAAHPRSGHMTTDVFAIRLGSSGVPIETRSFGGFGNDDGVVLVDQSGRLFASGTTRSDDLPIVNAIEDRHPDGPLFKTDWAGDRWNAMSGGLTGSIRALTIDPRTPTTLYAATFDAVFKSVDGGARWSTATEGMNIDLLAATDIAVDPSASSIVFAATGPGTYKSTDGGVHWTLVDRPTPGSGTRSVIAISPIDVNRVWVGTAGAGVRISDDGGLTWTNRNGGLPRHPGGSFVDVTSVAADPRDRDAAYLSAGSVFKTSDGGNTWIRLLPDVGGALLLHPSGRMYAAAGAWRSDNFGATWRRTNLGDALTTAAAIDPRNADVVYVGQPRTIRKTADGGANWITIDNGLTTRDFVNAIAVDPVRSQRVFAGSGQSSAPYIAVFRPLPIAARGVFGPRTPRRSPDVVLSSYLGKEDWAGLAVDPAGHAYVLTTYGRATARSGLAVTRITPPSN